MKLYYKQKMIQSFIFFFIFATNVFAWENPIKIVESGRSLSLSTNSKQDISHIIWRTFGNSADYGDCHYTKMQANHQFNSIKLDPTLNRPCIDADIINIKNSDTILAILTLYRENASQKCDAYEKNDKGCTEIYLIKSTDNGESWSEPEIISSYGSIYANKYNPKISYIEEINRVIVSYICEDIDGKRIQFEIYQIAFDHSKPEFSKLAIKMQPIKLASFTKIRANLGYTIDSQSNIKLFLIWQQSDLNGKSGLFGKTVSTDMGITWQEREFISQFDTPVNFQQFSVSEDKNEIYLTFSGYQQSAYAVVMNRKKTIKFPEKIYSTANCVYKNKLFIVENGFSYLTFGYINLLDMNYISIDKIEVYKGQYADIVKMDCFENDQGKIQIRAITNTNYWPNDRKTTVEFLFTQFE